MHIKFGIKIIEELYNFLRNFHFLKGTFIIILMTNSRIIVQNPCDEASPHTLLVGL